MRVGRAAALFTLGFALACGNSGAPNTGNGDGGVDAGSDGGSGNDAGVDGGSDAGSDGGFDAGPPPPGSPAAPALTATSTPSPASIQLSWTAGDALATQFQILRSTNSGGFTQLAQVAATSTAYNDSAVSPGNSYGYKVTGSDDAGTGAASNEIDVLAAPSDVGAGGSDTRIVITWGPIDNADSYDVYRVPSSGAAQLLGNSSGNDFLDDGSVQTISAGASYSYRVVAKSAGSFVASIGSNLAMTSALGLDVAANEIFVSDGSEQSVSLAPLLALQARNVDGGPLLDSNGAPIVYSSVSSGSAIVVPGVPHGTYAITVEGYSDFTIGSARAVDFSQAVAGRDGIEAASNGTTIAYDLTGLSPWASSADAGLVDALEELSLGAGDYSANLAFDLDTPPDAGATIFAGTEELGSDTDSNLIDADAGDALYIFQLHTQTSSNQVSYLAPAALYSSHAFTTSDGAASSIAGAMSSSTPIAIADFDFPRSGYLDPTHATQNPLATNPTQRVYLELEKGFAAHGWYSNESLADGLIIDIPQDGGTSESDGGVDLDVGAVGWSNPVAPSWDSFVLVQATYDVPFAISFEDTSMSPPVSVNANKTFTSYSSATVPMSALTFVNSALLPALSAPRSPLLNGSSIFTTQANVSPTSRLSWSAPAFGAPGYYLVVVYALVPETNDDGTFVTDANGDYLVDVKEAASFTSKDLSVSLSADLVPAGYNYFATIDAIANATASAAIDGTVSPYTLGEHYASAETVTSTFTIAAPDSRDRRAALSKNRRAPPPVKASALTKGPGPKRLPPRLR